MSNIAEQYANGNLNGWAGPELAKREFEILYNQGAFRDFKIGRPAPEPRPRTGKKMFLYEVVRKALGKDTENYRQEIGDCVSFGMKNAVEYLQCCEILLKGDAEKFQNIFPPYIYGISRNQIGGGRISGDGSLGSWAADGVKKYGILSSVDQGVPQYSGNIAKQWGSRSGVPSQFIPIGQKHLIKSAAQITSVDALADAICNGYPCTVASNQGFNENPDSKGFHRAQGNWGHQMAIVGIDMEYSEPYVLILNSWGDCFSDDTEILTENGWFKFSDLARNIKVATLNPNNWHLEYQTPIHYIEKTINDTLVSFGGRDVDLLVTNTHNIYHCQYNNDKNDLNNWNLTPYHECNKHFFIKKDAIWNGSEQEYHYIDDIKIKMDDWLQFLGYFLSEGYTSIYKRQTKRILSNGDINITNNGYSRRIGICQRKPEILSKIYNICKMMPFACHQNKHGLIFSNKKLYNELKCFGKAHEKYIPSYAKQLSSRQQKILFDALMEGDGSVSKCATGEKVTYYTSSKKLADDMQELLLKIGYVGDISYTDRINRKTNGGVTRYVEYRVGVKRHELMQHVNNHGIYIPYNGKVYCVTVPNGIIYVRRNGKAVWCGNCHGRLKSFYSEDTLPVGILRARINEIERTMIAGGDSEVFAVSQYDGYPEQRLDKALFRVL